MIEIFVDKNRLCVKLDPHHQYYDRAVVLVMPLLSAFEQANNVWSIDYDDLEVLKSKLDQFGLVMDRTITQEALDFIERVQFKIEYNNQIKNRSKNDEIRNLIKDQIKTALYEDQLTGVAYLLNNKRAGLFDSMGVGKAQPLTANILTPIGWRLLGDIRVGDEIINSQGGVSKVTGVFPQGVKSIYKVTFSDGSSTECCDNHLWRVQTPSNKYYSENKFFVKELKDIKDDLFYDNGNRKWYIPIVKPIQFEEKKLPLHPYLLGCLLGDGGFSTTCVILTSCDLELVEFIRRVVPDEVLVKEIKSAKYGYRLIKSERRSPGENLIVKALKSMGLMGLKSGQKFIPEEYKLSSWQDRLDILSGLLDTDGYVGHNSSIEYSSVSTRLAQDVMFLVRSLGGKAVISEKMPTFVYKGVKKVGQKAYRINISFSGFVPPFKLSRKSNNWHPRTKYPPVRGFDKVEYVGEKESVCISVDAEDQLYITDDFIVTHNTAQALATSIISDCSRVLIICPKSVLPGFSREVEKHTYKKAIICPPGQASIQFLKTVKNSNWNYLLINPETLVGSGKKDGIGEATLFLKDMPFDMIIVDEFHMYKNLDAKRTKCMIKLLKEIKTSKGDSPRVIVMTGTPVSESPINAYTFLKSVGVYLPHVSRFENYFTIKETKTYGKTKSFKKVVGYKNLEFLKRRIERRSIRRTKDDLVGFPDITLTCRDVEITGMQRKLYQAIQTELLHDLPQSSKINLVQFLTSAKAIRLRQVLSSPEILGEKVPSAKHEEVDLILDELFQDPEAKVILWTEYRDSVDLLYERYNDLYGAFKLYGGMDIDSAMIEKFEASGGPRVAVAIPAKAGTGVDFLARARTAIYVDRPYSYVLYKQSLDRIHRRVKTAGELSWLDRVRSQPANIIFLDGVNTIDELVRDKLGMKSDIADAITTSNDKLVEIGREDLLRYLK